MSTPNPDDAPLTAATRAVRDWNTAFPQPCVPVLVDTTDPDEVEFTDGRAFLSGLPGDPDRVALIRIRGRSWRGTRLDTVRPHPRAAEIVDSPAVEMETLQFPPPQCPYCLIDLDHDGDGWSCKQCRACWFEPGQPAFRVCVEEPCGGARASTLGADGQPRCPACQFLILLGHQQPTGPYACSAPHCFRQRVIGMPYAAPARRHQRGTKPRCGSCQERAEREQWWSDYRQRR